MDAFLRGRRGGLIYHSIRYRELLMDHLGCEPEYLVARESGEIRGVLPMRATDSGGWVCNSLPFYGSHGSPVADDPTPSGTARRLQRAGHRQAYACRDHGRQPVLATIPRPQSTTSPRSASAKQPCRLDRADPEVLMGLFAKNAGAMSVSADRRGVKVGLDHESLGDLCHIHQENLFAAGGLPKSNEFFEGLAGTSIVPRISRSLGCPMEESMVAALLVLYFAEWPNTSHLPSIMIIVAMSRCH